MSVLTVPALSLVVLVGTTGSGKSTFAHRHFRSSEVLSSDAFRAMVADDENDQSATRDAFEVLHVVAGKRLAAGRLTVVDATNVQQHARKSLLALAKEHDVLPVAIVLDVPEQVCAQRNAGRPDRAFGPHVLRRQREDLRRSLRGLQREGFRHVHVLAGVDAVDDAQVVRTPLFNDLRQRTGPFDVVGDVHGCREELETLLDRLGYVLVRDGTGRPVDAVPPAGRTAVLVGDLVDRGPDTPGVLRLVMGMVENGHALCVTGNHENKLLRALRGAKVTVSHGLAESLAQLEAQPEEFRGRVEAFLDGLVAHYVLDGGKLVVAHAGLAERYHGRASGRVRSLALYGETTGETDEFGLPVRYPWAQDYRGAATVLYGHTPVPTVEWVNNTLCLDTGCVFGGRLTALRYPEREVVSVPARAVHYEPVRPLGSPGGTGSAPGLLGPTGAARAPGVLDLRDVLPSPGTTHGVQTRLMGRVTVREENAAAALEVMSRFAVDPRRLVYLPPTMSPVATSALPGLLEHPAEAFAAYRAAGAGSVICEEKHMGSRAVVLLDRDDPAGGADGARGPLRMPHANGSRGEIWTRTGRPFLDPARTAALLGRLASAAEAAGLWEELGTSWLLLDAEVLPWSAKAEELLRARYAAVGAAAAGAFPAALDALDAAARRGLDVGDLADRTSARADAAARFTGAYRRYCWPTSGLDGVSVAPFQVLAAEGRTFLDRPHAWHLALADRLVAADPVTVRTTRRVEVDLDDDASCAAATAWWCALTDAGGEGMVVKPADPGRLAAAGRTRVQPGLKVRGPEYLRIVYGPDYLLPGNLERLRHRSLGRKAALALREHALGVEALERAVAGEPLWRVHECVFAVLALESEPVDPRL